MAGVCGGGGERRNGVGIILLLRHRATALALRKTGRLYVTVAGEQQHIYQRPHQDVFLTPSTRGSKKKKGRQSEKRKSISDRKDSITRGGGGMAAA